MERVVAAAMIYNGVTCSLPAPARHGDIIHAIARSVGEKHWPVDGEQGFLTSTGRFVSRMEARKDRICRRTDAKRQRAAVQ